VVPSTEGLLIIEDSRELAPDHPHLVRLAARQGNSESAGAVTLTNLVWQALRMHPDLLVGRHGGGLRKFCGVEPRVHGLDGMGALLTGAGVDD